ncbi:MAG: OmpA family protein [Bernardetiaceae bacterium]|nr:OmpA family protein [Bernardetiaceae bacterium]
MPRKIIILSLIGLLTLISSLYGQQTHLTLDTNNPIEYQNLRIYPIRASEMYLSHFGEGNFLKSADRAIRAGQASISEFIVLKPDGSQEFKPQVSALLMDNLSPDTLYALGGSLLEGGKQNRMLRDDVIVMPNKKRERMPVFCIEEGRWSSESNMNFNFVPMTAPQSVKEQGMRHNNQQLVWNNVSDYLSRLEIKSATDDLLAVSKHPLIKDKQPGYLKHFAQQFPKDKDIVGFIALTNDRVIGAEVFAHAIVLQDNLQSLISSYSTEAILFGLASSAHAKEAAVSYTNALVVSGTKLFNPDFVKEHGKSTEFQGKPFRTVTFGYEVKNLKKLARIWFDSDADQFHKDSLSEAVNTLIHLAKANPNTKLRILGHTDSDASESYNLQLAKRRSERVKQYLIAQGIDKNRIITEYYGESYPIADNTDEAQKALNRRVDIFMIL